MGTLKLYGMRSAYDEIMGVAIKRQHEPPRIVGDLLQAGICRNSFFPIAGYGLRW